MHKYYRAVPVVRSSVLVKDKSYVNIYCAPCYGNSGKERVSCRQRHVRYLITHFLRWYSPVLGYKKKYADKCIPQTFTCSKSTIEALEKSVQSVQN